MVSTYVLSWCPSTNPLRLSSHLTPLIINQVLLALVLEWTYKSLAILPHPAMYLILNMVSFFSLIMMNMLLKCYAARATSTFTLNVNDSALVIGSICKSNHLCILYIHVHCCVWCIILSLFFPITYCPCVYMYLQKVIAPVGSMLFSGMNFDNSYITLFTCGNSAILYFSIEAFLTSWRFLCTT